MNEAIKEGAKKGLGYGESLAVYIEKKSPKNFHIKKIVFYIKQYKNGVPDLSYSFRNRHNSPTPHCRLCSYRSNQWY